jgi:hypothetical protein
MGAERVFLYSYISHVYGINFLISPFLITIIVPRWSISTYLMSNKTPIWNTHRTTVNQ